MAASLSAPQALSPAAAPGLPRALAAARGTATLEAVHAQVLADRRAARHRTAERAADAAQAAAARQAAVPPPAAAPLVAQPSGDPQATAAAMLGSYGWSGQFGCLQALWDRESGWNPYAENPDGAYGIPQALPGSKMASAGADWQTNPATQIRWGLGYIQSAYGSPCAAWSHEEATGWY